MVASEWAAAAEAIDGQNEPKRRALAAHAGIDPERRWCRAATAQHRITTLFSLLWSTGKRFCIQGVWCLLCVCACMRVGCCFGFKKKSEERTKSRVQLIHNNSPSQLARLPASQPATHACTHTNSKEDAHSQRGAAAFSALSSALLYQCI